ncbi:MAG TPA: hypothetical protein VKX45_16365 [Bryobacteraceae bacterium]|nr:hypothetical protein [Bryobacteraceae bacterium]
MQTLDQQTQTKTSVLGLNATAAPQQETNATGLPTPKRRPLRGEDERPARAHVLRRAVVLVVLAMLVGAGIYLYRPAQTYFNRLSLVPAMQEQIGAAGRRLDAAEGALHSWTSQREEWAKRLSGVESKVDGVLHAARRQAEQLVARAQRNMQAELDRRTTSLQARMDGLQSSQQLADSRLDRFEQQLHQVQAANQRDLENLRAEMRQSRESDSALMANVNRRLADVDERSSQSRTDLAAIHRNTDRERIDFELGVDRDRELAQGINMDVTHTDVLHQRFDGRVFLMPDRKTIWVHSRGIQQPLTFYSQADQRPRELVITRVTKYSVIGYVLTPKEPAAAPGAENRLVSASSPAADSSMPR